MGVEPLLDDEIPPVPVTPVLVGAATTLDDENPPLALLLELGEPVPVRPVPVGAVPVAPVPVGLGIEYVPLFCCGQA